MPSSRTAAAGQAQPRTNRPFSKTNGGYLKSSSKTDSKWGAIVSRCLVAHAVDDEVHAELVGERRVLERVLRPLRPFPRVPEVGVRVDHDHQPAVVVEDAAQVGCVPVPLRGLAAHGVPDVRDLEQFLDVVERVPEGMVARKVDDPAAGEHAADLALEMIP